jgi:hypothetical protein
MRPQPARPPRTPAWRVFVVLYLLAGGEYDLVDAFARILKLDRWYEGDSLILEVGSHV